MGARKRSLTEKRAAGSLAALRAALSHIQCNHGDLLHDDITTIASADRAPLLGPTADFSKGEPPPDLTNFGSPQN
jgi:hypothetical protein